MSIYWDRKTYTAFKYRIGCKISPREKLIEHRRMPCPGNVFHKVDRADIIFNNFQKKHKKSYIMYWRRNHLQYDQMIELMTSRRNNKKSV